MNKGKGTSLKQKLKRSDALILPGVYDALSAFLAYRAGLDAVFLSGSAVAYTQLAQPDVGLVSMTEMAAICSRITESLPLSVVVDADSGFGNTLHAIRAIRVFEQAGAAAIQMEDQISVKPMRDLKSRPLISKSAMADKIKAAADIRSGDILISARSDSPFSEPMELTLERVALYRDAGADIIFVEGLKSSDAVLEVIKESANLPVLYNLLNETDEFSSVMDLEQIGVSGVIFPTATVLPCAFAVQQSLEELATSGAIKDQLAPITARDLNDMLGLPEMLKKYEDYSAE